MAREREALLLDKKASSGYIGLSRSDSTSSLDYLTRNTMSEKAKKLSQVYDEVIEKATYPWKFIVRKIYAREVLAEFLGTFILVVSKKWRRPLPQTMDCSGVHV